MMVIETQIDFLKRLRERIQDLLHSYNPENSNYLHSLIEKQQNANAWLTEEFTLVSLHSLIEKLDYYTNEHNINSIVPAKKSLNLGIITDENIPLAGIDECIFSVLYGHRLWFKAVNQKYILLQTLIELVPGLTDFVKFSTDFPKNTDAWVIHTNQKGNNSALKNYFNNKKTLFCSRPIHIGILNGNETKSDLDCLADNIFIYWGFHPENIRKLFLPKGFSFDPFFQALEKYNYLYNHNRYANNYDYHKSIYLMDSKPFLDNGFMMLYETDSLEIPIGSVGYQTYETQADLKAILNEIGGIRNELPPRFSYINPLFKSIKQPAYMMKYSSDLPVIDFFKGL
jgi:hypothetical protein